MNRMHHARALLGRLILRSSASGRRLGPAVGLLLLLGVPSVVSAPDAQPFAEQLEIDGPFPTRQRVALFVHSVKIGEAGDAGPALGEPVFRVRLDAQPCPAVFEPFVDAVIVNTPIAQFDAGDCDYAHRVRRGPYSVSNGETVEINVQLPEPTAENTDPWLPVLRYRGDLVRVRMGGTELDYFEDDPMGGAIAVFSQRRNFGSDGDPWSSGRGEYPFDTCPPGGLWACYSSALFVYVEPEPADPERDLKVSSLWGPGGHCLAGGEQTLGVTLHNQGHATSQGFRARIGLLDSESGAIVREWTSAPQRGLPAGAANAGPIPVTIESPRGSERYVVGAVADDGPMADNGPMASAVEFSLFCLPIDPIPRIVDDLLTPTPNGPDPQRDVRLPTRTATPEPDGPGRRPTATPTATPEPGRDLDPLFPR